MALLETTVDVETVREAARPLTGTAGSYDDLLKLIGASRYVLLGEGSHGTHEFYRARIEITKRLIREKGFTAIAWEADWPDALRVNRFIHNSRTWDAVAALEGFQRFPSWMWRNADVLDFVGWLASHNAEIQGAKVGVYGLDLYSLHSSMNAVVNYLDRTDPVAAKAARQRYACFDHFGGDPQVYGQLAGQLSYPSCENEVVEQLLELQRHEADFLRSDGDIAEDELFFAEQNARVAVNAEEYYRAMYRGRENTWNLRDQHMVEILDDLMTHLQQRGQSPRVVVWAHNSHLGDARATEMTARGELNLGQLVRQRHAGDAVLVGFTTYAGTVTAATEWGGFPERKTVRPGLDLSYEKLFHDTAVPAFYLELRGNPTLAEAFASRLLERAIGVIYHPDAERWNHYFHADLAQQFDAVIHFDRTRAVEPLDLNAEWQSGELPETYPSGV